MNFDIEELACKYCENHGIDEFNEVRNQVITAFCVSARIERESCAKIAEEFNTFPHGLSMVGKKISEEIRTRR